MKKATHTRSKPLVGNRFAVGVIAVLFAASAAGWILTELVPPDVPTARDAYVDRWGKRAVDAVLFLRLHDPFHFLKDRGVLGLFLVTTSLCVATRWPGILRRSFRLDAPASLPRGPHRLTVPWKRPGGDERDIVEHHRRRFGAAERLDEVAVGAAAERLARHLRSRGWRVAMRADTDSVLFAAQTGRFRSVGTLLFHLGLLLVTVGAVVTSVGGRTEILYGRPGDALPLQGDDRQLLVRDFDILRGPSGELLDYVSVISVIDAGGDTVRTATVEVNKPFSVGPWEVFQSSWFIDEDVFEQAIVEWRSASAPPRRIRLRPGEEVAIDGLVLRARRFLPDFRTGPGGAWSASGSMENPALLVEFGDSARTERGWLFLRYPAADKRFARPGTLAFIDVEPVYVTGLQVSRDPGSAPVLAGVIIATLGLGMMYSTTRRSLLGAVEPEALVIAGAGGGWRSSLDDEIGLLAAAAVGGVAPIPKTGDDR